MMLVMKTNRDYIGLETVKIFYNILFNFSISLYELSIRITI